MNPENPDPDSDRRKVATLGVFSQGIEAVCSRPLRDSSVRPAGGQLEQFFLKKREKNIVKFARQHDILHIENPYKVCD